MAWKHIAAMDASVGSALNQAYASSQEKGGQALDMFSIRDSDCDKGVNVFKFENGFRNLVSIGNCSLDDADLN